MSLFRFLSRKTPAPHPENVGKFIAGLSKVAPPVGGGAYAFPCTQGKCRGWVQFIIQSGRQVVIHRLWTLQPGQGNGTHILRTVCGLADEHAVELVLKTLPFGRKPYPLQRDHLIAWYGRHGFVGSNKKMIRPPQPFPAPTAA